MVARGTCAPAPGPFTLTSPPEKFCKLNKIKRNNYYQLDTK